MKKIFFVLTISAFCFVCIYGQGIPETINYQGLLKDTSGVIVPNGNFSITFKLYDSESGGAELWTETKLVNVIDGIINTRLGNLTPIPSSIFAGMTWLGITVETGIELTPRIALSSVPYSFISINVPDGSITETKIANAQVVKSLNGIKDDVTLVAGTNITITPGANNITGITVGSGLTGGGTSGNVTLAVSSSGIKNAMLQNNSVTTSKVLDGSILHHCQDNY